MPEYRLVKHRKRYSLAFTDPERGRVRIALGTNDRGLAEARAREVWRARHQPPSERLKDVWDAYVADKAIDGVDADPSGSTWRALEPSFGHRLASAITREDCRAHTEKRRLAVFLEITHPKPSVIIWRVLATPYQHQAPQNLPADYRFMIF